ncbi:CIC11C00000001845 [Sungouiella intermedia]|uniref:CIC11C00000001845 n=1 Tax=Sungouiella intermedia TaxID=45354 RepID=A0A1L0DK92_9ASCO|nr:CIC11C00000001845 [[Candida] intermedia]
MGRDIITLDDLTVNNLGTFKKLILVTLPTTYPESWYKDSLNSDQIVKIAFYSELPVGEIKGKLINSSHNIPTFEVASAVQLNSKIIPNAVYLESLSVLEAYRALGIGSKLLNWAIEEAKLRFVHEIVLHVHVDNTAAIEWYKKKGFSQVGEKVVNYYKEQGLENPDAVILSLKF